MIMTSLRLFLLIVLAMLQFIAPLVHAHAGQNYSSVGLHIPGLELYGIAPDSVTPPAHSHYSSSEGFIFSVDTGIKQSRALTISDTQSNYYLPRQSRVFRAAIPSIDTDFPPQLSRFVSSLPTPSRSPRAPPFNNPN